MTWGGSAIPGVREKGITINGEAIDISSDDDDGWRKLLDVPGERSVDISISGVLISDAVKAALFNGSRTQAVVLTYPSGAVITGDFYLGTLSETEPYKGEATFDATLQSTGEVTFTPAP